MIPLLILIARPAAGKSEIIAYLQGLSQEERLSRFNLGRLHRIDDFPMLWAWFEEDRILEDMGKPRLHTDKDGYFSDIFLWDLLIKRICLEYDKLKRDIGEGHSHNDTVVIEFSRGSEHGGFRRAFENLSNEILSTCAVMYIDVSYEESVRKNQKRFNPERPDSILEHGLPAEKMEKLYRESDWLQLLEESTPVGQSCNRKTCGFLHIRDYRIPYAVFDNEDDVTTTGGEALAQRLGRTIKYLMQTLQDA